MWVMVMLGEGRRRVVRSWWGLLLMAHRVSQRGTLVNFEAVAVGCYVLKVTFIFD